PSGGARATANLANASYKARHGDHIEVQPPAAERPGPQAEDIPLHVLHEDDYLAVINKPADMVVHPAKGHWSGTLVNALRHRFPKLSGLNRDYPPATVHPLHPHTTRATPAPTPD